MRFLGLLACIGLSLAVPGPVSAQHDAGTTLGPHGIGFRLLQARDSTRSFRPKRDVHGERVEGESARPILVALWYPAAPAPDAVSMALEDFRAVGDIEWAFTMGTEGAGSPAPEGESTRMTERVVRDAPPLPGPHPVVLIVGPAWASDQRTPAILASHGYVVASVALIGRMTHATLEYTPNPLSLDTGVDDLGFVHALLRRESIADTDRLALFTFSATSLDALLWHLRDMQADALVFVESWERVRYGADLLRRSVHYDPLRVRVPVLLVEGQPPDAGGDPSFALVGDIVDSLAYADVTRVTFPAAQHGDFLSDVSFPGSEQRERVYGEMLSIIRRFLDANLRGDAAAARDIEALSDDGSGLFRVQRTSAVPPMPTEEELFRLAEVDPEGLVALVRELGERSPGRPLIREHVLSRAAVFSGNPEGRILLSRFVVETYPQSTNAQWQLARFLFQAGATNEAREALEAARRNIESDPEIEPSQRQGWIERIEQALAGG